MVEIMIVVVGIFIGLQVDDWNERRKKGLETERFLVRLSSDLEQIEANMNELRTGAERISTSARLALVIMDRCDAGDAERDDYLHALDKYQNVFAPRIFRAAYDEMQSVGAFTRLESDVLKDKLAEVYSRLEWAVETVGFMRIDLSNASEILWSRVRFGVDPDALESADVDLLAHCDDLLMRNAIWELADTNTDILQMIGEFLPVVDEAQELLARERNR